MDNDEYHEEWYEGDRGFFWLQMLSLFLGVILIAAFLGAWFLLNTSPVAQVSIP